MLRKIVAAMVLVPLAVVIIAFAVANRQFVTVSFDPFGAPGQAAAVSLPLFAVMMIALIFGVLVGGLATRLSHGKWRRLARRLERDASELRARLHVHEAAAAPPSAVPRETEPPPRLKLTAPVR